MWSDLSEGFWTWSLTRFYWNHITWSSNISSYQAFILFFSLIIWVRLHFNTKKRIIIKWFSVHVFCCGLLQMKVSHVNVTSVIWTCSHWHCFGPSRNICADSRACWNPVLMRLYSLLLHSQALSCLSLWQASRERPSLWAWAARSAARRSASTTRELRWASRLSTLTTATQTQVITQIFQVWPIYHNPAAPFTFLISSVSYPHGNPDTLPVNQDLYPPSSGPERVRYVSEAVW